MKTIVKNCRECGKTFSITPEQQQSFTDKGLSIPERCPGCREKRRQVEHVTCKDCGQLFPMNQLEVEYYFKMGYEQPKRCLECRRKRREVNKEYAKRNEHS